MSEDESTPQYALLVSAEGHEIYVERSIAIQSSKTIKLMLEGQFREASSNRITFPDISSYVLERIVSYFHYKAQHSYSTTRIPEFVIEPEVALELLIASKYLDC